MTAVHGYNIGLEVTNCYVQYFDHREKELNGLIDQLKMTNIQVKIISDVMNKLSHSKQKDKQADFNNDEIAKKYAYLIYLRNPTVFEDKIHGIQETDINLDQKLQEIVNQMREDGFSESDIHLGTILDRIFPGNIQIDILSEDQIDIVIQALDAETKMLTADLNEQMMKINNKYEDRSQMTENARQVLKEADDHIKSIINRSRSN